MQKVKLSDLNILDIGNSIAFSGVIYGGPDTHYHCYLSEDVSDDVEHKLLPLSSQDWEKVIRQTDLLETEVLAKAPDGKLCKVLIRKSTRQIEQGVSWAVYHRDGYRCRYCAIQGVPMTVDHLVLWEKGGPSIAANLITACRKCNKVRSNTEFADWLKHPHYLKMSKNLSPEVQEANRRVLATLADIPVRIQERSR